MTKRFCDKCGVENASNFYVSVVTLDDRGAVTNTLPDFCNSCLHKFAQLSVSMFGQFMSDAPVL